MSEGAAETSPSKWSLSSVTKEAAVVPIIAAGGILLGAIWQLYSPYLERQQTLEQRIESLSASLGDAAANISRIESEVQARQRLVDSLRRDAATAEALMHANRQQVEAVAQVLRAEIDRGKNWDFWVDLMKNAAFTLFGWALSELSGWWRKKRGLPNPTPAVEQP